MVSVLANLHADKLVPNPAEGISRHSQTERQTETKTNTEQPQNRELGGRTESQQKTAMVCEGY